MAITFANYISTTLLANITAVQTTFAVANVAGMPPVTTASGDYFYLTLIDSASITGNISPPNSREVVKVTNITGNTLTVVRGQDGTVGQVFTLGATAEIRFNAQAARDLDGPFFNVKSFQAKGDNATDDTAAVQAAFTAAIAVGGTVYFPAGAYSCNTINILGACSVLGDGYLSVIVARADADIGLLVNCFEPVYIRGLRFDGTGPTSTGACIKVSYPAAAPNINSGTIIEQCIFDVTQTGVYLDVCSNCTIKDNLFRFVTTAAGQWIAIDNTFNKDAGDHNITGNTFFGSIAPLYRAIYWIGGGGTRVTNNKILQANVLFQCDNATANATGQIYFTNNSMDGSTFTAANASGSFGFLGLTISDNQFYSVTASTNAITVIGGAAPLTFYNVVISGNSFNGNLVGVTNGVALYYVSNYSITGNSFTNMTNYGIYADATCIGGTATGNEFLACTPANYSGAGAGAKYLPASNSGASGVIADGATITHLLGATPTSVLVTGTVAAEHVAVTAKGATTFTVAIKNTAGGAGTNQVIYWQASL